jgi:hypothetical protein
MKKKCFLLSVTLLFCINTIGQVVKRTCLTHDKHLKMARENAGYLQKRESINNPVAAAALNKKISSQSVYTIPVVIHVIHNGEAEGTGGNISSEQINSAITALNLDFRSTNTDTLMPSHAFYSLQADVGIEFCLASENPQGAPTTGILRYDKAKASWGMDDFEANVKPGTIWDITKYLNIWVITFGTPDALTLGYATLPGWPTPSEVGVVIGAPYFGTTGSLDPNFNKNRTLTHEVGHFFNLSHIWGDATCGTDFVSDTPPQLGANDSNCPTFPHNNASVCNPGSNGEMFMNYMDYTLDACMQLFTTGQKDRMRTAILLPDRIGLTTSNLCVVSNNINRVLPVDINIYPNPTGNIATVSIPNNYQLSSITVTNLNGQKLNIPYVNEGEIITMNTSTLSNGTYIITIIVEGGTINKNLVILK